MSKTLLLLTGLASWLVAAPVLAVCPLANPALCIYIDVNDPNCLPPPAGIGSEANPFCGIQQAYDYVFDCSIVDPPTSQTCFTEAGNPLTLLVKPGTYNECVLASGFNPDSFFHEDRPVRLVADAWLEAGQPAPNPADTSAFEAVASMTTIDGNQCTCEVSGSPSICNDNGTQLRAALFLAGTGASVRGFAIKNGGDSGVDSRSAVDISYNFIFDNRGELGGGVRHQTEVCPSGDVDTEIAHNVITNNVADDDVDPSFLDGGDGGGIFVLADGAYLAFCTDPIGHLGGKSNVYVHDNLVTFNTAQNLDLNLVDDFAAAGGGMRIETFTLTQNDTGIDPDTVEVRVRAANNVVESNQVLVGGAGFGFGAGIAAATGFGVGQETIEIDHNVVGPGNVGTPTDTGVIFGGGISVSAILLIYGVHDVQVHHNNVFQNVGDFGGGIDGAIDVDNLFPAGQSVSLTLYGNTSENNLAVVGGGGLNADFISRKSLDLADQAEFFPGAAFPADEIRFGITDNMVLGNTSGFASGGALLRVSADADPEGVPVPPGPCSPSQQDPAVARIVLTGNLFQENDSQDTLSVGGCSDDLCESIVCDETFDSFCCDVQWDDICAGEAATVAQCNVFCSTIDCCAPVASQTIVGSGLFALAKAKGEAFAGVTLEQSTLVGNTIAGGFIGGVELASFTWPDCDGNAVGQVGVVVDRSIIGNNDSVGIGGPPPASNFEISVTKSSVYGNGGNGANQQYETTLFPNGTPPGNIVANPLLNAQSFVPALCSQVYDVGSCSQDPDLVCLNDAACGAGNQCNNEGAGFLKNPDLNDDDALDGVDVLQFSTAFATEELLDPRYNPASDFDRNGQVDGVDLPLIAPLFGQQCP